MDLYYLNRIRKTESNLIKCKIYYKYICNLGKLQVFNYIFL